VSPVILELSARRAAPIQRLWEIIMTKLRVNTATGKRAFVSGATSLDGNQLFRIQYLNRFGYIPQVEFVSNKARARDGLAKDNVLITSDQDWRAIIAALEDIDDFPPKLLLETPGWTAGYFAEASGKVYSPTGKKRARSIFKSAVPRPVRGTLAEWLREVGTPLTGQNLPIIAVLGALAAPLLKFSGETHNFGFEFFGPPATGKTTCLTLMASIAGEADHIPTFNATDAGHEGMFAEHQDVGFPIDEANLADRRDQDALIRWIFRMANGTPRITAHQPDRAQHRFIFATTANAPFYQSINNAHSDTHAAALQRLFPLQIANTSLGVFDKVPDGFATTGEFALYLAGAIARQTGHTYRAMLQTLVEELGAGEEILPTKIRQSIHRFAEAVGVIGSPQGVSRASTAFGLLYAAGRIAKEHGIVPEQWDCLAACVAGYRNYQAQVPEQTPLVTRLMSIAARPETLDLRSCEVPRLSNADVARHGAFIRYGVKGRVELLMTDEFRERIMPDWIQLQTDNVFRELNVRAKDHITTQRQVRRNRGKERLICFKLPESMAPPKSTSG
jgi:hypothetical protein